MFKRKTILYIDDDADDRELLGAELKVLEKSLVVEEAVNGVEALNYLYKAKAEQQLPCLIVLDLNMPVLDGRQTFQKIKQDELLQDIPLVVYTSSFNPNDRAYFSKAGVEFINKPLSTRYLKQIAEGMVGYCH